MANIASWNGHNFQVSADKVYSFVSLSVKASSETEDKTKSKQKYVSRKNSKPYEIMLTIQLDKRLGIKDVKSEAVSICEEARKGNKDYFYFAGKKLVNCKFMLVEAAVDKVEMIGSGEWIICEVKCTWKQCGKLSAEKSSSASKKKSSSKSKSKSKTKNTNKKSSNETIAMRAQTIAARVQNTTKYDVDAVSSAQKKNSSSANYVNNLSRNASNSSAKKKTSTKTQTKLNQVK